VRKIKQKIVKIWNKIKSWFTKPAKQIFVNPQVAQEDPILEDIITRLNNQFNDMPAMFQNLFTDFNGAV